ncbi:PilZ domain-containing protein [Roseibium sp.]|uniref:PilZ domain-containing protein n=1 Tax=Roseibium sp. TaxID=1936156 RepID=UPI003A987E3D
MKPLKASEVETQRQHPRFKLPLKVLLGKRQYLAADWSVGGVAINHPGADLQPGQTVELELQFPLSNYSISNRFLGVVKYVRPDLKRAGIEFTDVTMEQTSLLRFMIDKYLAGDLHQAEDVVAFMHRDPKAKARKASGGEMKASNLRSSVSFLQRLLGGLLVFCLLSGALSYLGYSMYQRLFIFQPKSSFISADLIPVVAPEGGLVSAVMEGTQIQNGDLIAALTGDDGSVYEIHSQCDCELVGLKPQLGDFYRDGQQLASLYSPVLEPYLVVRVKFNDLFQLEQGTSVRVTMLDGTQIELPPLAGNVGGDRLDPTSLQSVLDVHLPLPAEVASRQIGEPVMVTFDTFSITAFKVQNWAAQARQEAVSAWDALLTLVQK